MKPAIVVKLSRSILCAVVFSASGVVCQDTQTPLVSQPAARPFNMLVLGDSVLWGEGLKTKHKSWYQVKLWIERHTGRPVTETIKAHAGAMVEGGPLDQKRMITDGEVNQAYPTVNSEVDHALQHYGDGAKVDLILVTGCVNDIRVQEIFNATSSDEIIHLTEAKCGPPIERLLQKITTSFPNADVIVAGYYQFFSEKTRNDRVLRAFASKFLKTDPGTPELTWKEYFDRLIENSNTWYQASNRTLSEVVERVNTKLKGRGSRRRVMFAKVEFPPEFAFAADKTRLWGLSRSPCRLILVLLSFGKVSLPSNDEVRGKRNDSCKETFKERPNETPEQERERKYRRLLCRYAALGHPNKKGALLYSSAIIELLKSGPGGFATSP